LSAAAVRILHVFDHSLPLQSGYTFRSLSILREQRARGWETYHLTTPRHGSTDAEEETVDGWHFYRTPHQRGWHAAAPAIRELAEMRATAQRLTDLAARLRPDLLHAHSPVLNALPALNVGSRLGIPVVYEVRAFWEDAAVDHGSTTEGSLRYRLSRRLETAALKRAAHVTTICEGLRADIVRRGVPETKVTVIPNAVDAEAFVFDAPADAALRCRLGLDGNTVIGFVGSFYAYEGLDLLIGALPAVLAARPDARLLLVGGGPQEAALRALAHATGVQDEVVFAGRVPHGEVQRYYGLVDVLAYPRRSIRLTELVTPLKPLEAMAQGKLLVASDVGGHRELIRDGETGVLFKAGDVQALAEAILRLMSREQDWPRLRARGREFVERERTWRASVARYAPIYEQLVRVTA
jgi:PEP-CTERM/exosortase A-associated glycosyltransferase